MTRHTDSPSLQVCRLGSGRLPEPHRGDGHGRIATSVVGALKRSFGRRSSKRAIKGHRQVSAWRTPARRADVMVGAISASVAVFLAAGAAPRTLGRVDRAHREGRLGGGDFPERVTLRQTKLPGGGFA